MAQDPLHVLWIEPNFPGRLGAIADWLVRRRGYRGTFYCHTADPRSTWPASAGKGLDVQTFGVGGIARDAAVSWTRALERSLCYSYGCWEVLDQRKPRPIDLIVGRSNGLGSSLFAPVHLPAAPVVNFLDYFYHAHENDLAEDPSAPAAYFHWRRSMAAIELLDLEHTTLPWTATNWQRSLYPGAYQDEIWVQHDGIDTNRFTVADWQKRDTGPRKIAGRTIPAGSRVVTFVARSLERLRGFDRFVKIAGAIQRARSDVLFVVIGEPIVRRGLDITFHHKDYAAHALANDPVPDPSRLVMLGVSSPAVVAEVLANSDLHLAPGRAFPAARSLLEAMASGSVVIASDTAPHREIISPNETGFLVDGDDIAGWTYEALAVLDDPPAHRPIARAAAESIRNQFSQECCLPRIAERFSSLLAAQGRRP
jgi:glycosyltransferase involved in cell wall biosynthesis